MHWEVTHLSGPGSYRIWTSLLILLCLCLCFQTRSRFEGTRSEVFELMKRIKDSPQEYRQTSPISSEGYLYVQEKRTQDKFYDVTLGCLLFFTDCHVMCPVLCWLHCWYLLLFPQDLLLLDPAGWNAIPRLSKNRKFYTWRHLTRDQAGSL